MRPSSPPQNNYFRKWVLPDLIQNPELPLAKQNDFVKESKLRITHTTYKEIAP